MNRWLPVTAMRRKLRGVGMALAVMLLHLWLLAQLRPGAAPQLVGSTQPLVVRLVDGSQARRADPVPRTEVLPDAGIRLPPSDAASAGAALVPVQPGLTELVPAASDLRTPHRVLLDEGPITLEYQLAEIQNVQVEIGSMRLRLSGQAGRYEAQSDWSVGARTGSRISRGVMDAALLQPDSYQASQEQAGDATVAVDAAQDRLSVIWNLRDLLASHMQAAASASPEGLQWNTALQDLGAMSHMHWVFAQMDELVLPAGHFRAAQMAGAMDGDQRSQTRIWYALDMDYLPVRIATTYADGHVEDAMLALRRD